MGGNKDFEKDIREMNKHRNSLIQRNNIGDELEVTIGDVIYPNPLFIASSPASATLDQYIEAWKHGAGAIITKTIMDRNPGKKGEDNRRAIWTPDHTSVFNTGSTAVEMASIDDAIKDIEIAIREGIAIIPNIGTKKVFNYSELNNDKIASVIKGLENILDGPIEQIFDVMAYKSFLKEFGKRKISEKDKQIIFVQRQLYGMIDLRVMDCFLRPIYLLKKKLVEEGIIGGINVEINMRYYLRQVERVSELMQNSSRESFSRNKIPSDFGFLNVDKRDEYYTHNVSIYRKPKHQSNGKNDEKLRKSYERFWRNFEYFLKSENWRNEAIFRSIFALGKLSEKYGIGLIAKFPFRSDLVDLSQAAELAGFKGVTLINTIKAPAYEESLRSIEYPGIRQTKEMQLSGGDIRQLSRSAINRTRKKINIPILASGGVAIDLLRKPIYFSSIENILKEGFIEMVGGFDKFKKKYEEICDSDSESIENLIEIIESKEKLDDKKVKAATREIAKTATAIINERQATMDVWDRIFIGSNAVQLSTAVLANPGFKGIESLLKGLKLDLELYKAMYKYYVANPNHLKSIFLNLKKKIDRSQGYTDVGHFSAAISKYIQKLDIDENLKRGFLAHHIFNGSKKTLKKIGEFLDNSIEVTKGIFSFLNIDMSLNHYENTILLPLSIRLVSSIYNELKKNNDIELDISNSIDYGKFKKDLDTLHPMELRKKYGQANYHSYRKPVLDNFVGLLSRLSSERNLFSRFVAEYDEKRCTNDGKATPCGNCFEGVNYCNAISYIEKSGKKIPSINQENCSGCGTCYEFCEKDAIKMVKG